VDLDIRPVSGGAGKEGVVFGGTRKGCMSVFGAIFVCVSTLRWVYLSGVGSLCV
jgi:hypothetical protein